MSAGTLRLVGARGRFEIRGQAVLGRDAGCDVVLADKSVSRRHAAIEWDGQRWIVQDLDSANGVFIGGQRVTAAELCHDGDITFGSLFFRVEIKADVTAEEAEDPEALAATRIAPRGSRLPVPPTPVEAIAPPAAVAPAPEPPAAPPALDAFDEADLPAAQPVLSVEALAEPVRAASPRGAAAAAAPRVADGPSLWFLAWFVPNVLIGALGLYFFLGAHKSGSDLAALEADAQKVEAERLEHLQAGALLAEGAPEALVLCNRGGEAVRLAWIGALYRQGDESIRNFNSDYCPDQELPLVAPGAEVRFRSTRERPAECRWDGARPLVVAWRPATRSAGFRVVRLADLQGQCLDLSR